MKWNKSDTKAQLDDAIRAICEDDLSAGQMEQTATRVRGSLENRVPAVIAAETERIEGCHSFQALIPGYLSNRLSPARRTLFEDHMRECAGCRRVFWQARSGATETALPPKNWRPIVVYKWGVAAAVLLVFAAINLFVIPNVFWPAQDVSATAERIDGSLHARRRRKHGAGKGRPGDRRGGSGQDRKGFQGFPQDVGRIGGRDERTDRAFA